MGKLGWIGAGLGFVLSGPIGAIIGGVIGNVVGSMFNNTNGAQPYAQHQSNTVQGDFIVSLLVLIAAVMKADGKVVKSELDYVRMQLSRMLGANGMPQTLQLLRDILQKDISLPQVCKQISVNMEYSYRLELLHLLFGISKADGNVDEREIKVIEEIAFYLDLTREDIASIKAMFVKDAKSAYKILEIEPSATDDDVKKAYRKMAVKFHPDKVAHLGDELQTQAKEKFQEVQKAYEDIKKERGI